MRRLIPAGAVLLLLATTLQLKTSAHRVYAPMTVRLDGELVGANSDDLNTCLLSEEWIGETLTSAPPPNTKHTIPCATSLDDGKVPRKFNREVTLQEPGIYIYKILFTPRGQRTMASGRSRSERCVPGSA